MLKVFDLVLREYLHLKYDIIERIIIKPYKIGTTIAYEINIWLKYNDDYTADNLLNDYKEEKSYIISDVRLVAELVNLDKLTFIFFQYPPSFV
jgi:hypothetical protein